MAIRIILIAAYALELAEKITFCSCECLLLRFRSRSFISVCFQIRLSSCCIKAVKKLFITCRCRHRSLG